MLLQASHSTLGLDNLRKKQHKRLDLVESVCRIFQKSFTQCEYHLKALGKPICLLKIVWISLLSAVYSSLITLRRLVPCEQRSARGLCFNKGRRLKDNLFAQYFLIYLTQIVFTTSGRRQELFMQARTGVNRPASRSSFPTHQATSFGKYMRLHDTLLCHLENDGKIRSVVFSLCAAVLMDSEQQSEDPHVGRTDYVWI